jgi:hypothetical protein
VQVLERSPKIPVGRGKYGCKYYNKTPKFQLIEVSINEGITKLNEESTFDAIPTCMVVSK